MKENLYGQDFIEKLKSKNDIVSIISKYVRLDKKGKNFWGCCPFHHEKTPSFCINEYEQFYHCFGCGESGDVITFLRKYENMEYAEAIKFLAENVGMELPVFENNDQYIKNKKIKDRSLEILNLAKEFYKKNIYLPEAKLAQEYIKKRKVTKKELEDFELGYSVDPFQIVNFLKEKGFSNEELKLSGVCEISKSGKPYDFLAERLVFPIVNTMGDCIGFSGRDLKNSGIMKYKNTSATLVFDKSKTIYGINLIKKLKQSGELGEIILVEGQFDVITMHRYGFENTVACLGTAITKDHIRDLKRFVDNIVLCLDGDSAGQKATLRALGVFENSGLNIKVVVLPNKQDPDEFLQNNGSEALKDLIKNAIAPMAFKIHLIKLQYDISKNDEKSKFVKNCLKEISTLSANAEQEIYLNEIKNLTKIPIDILRRDLTNTSQTKTTSEKEVEPLTSEKDATTKAIKYVLACYLTDKSFVNFESNIEPYISNPTLKKLYNLILDKKKANKKLIISCLFDEFDIDNEPNIKDIINFDFKIIENQEKYFNECLWLVVESELKFKKSVLSKQYSEEKLQENRKNILFEINKINQQLMNKNLGSL
ncbi:MAG: DNA primase [Clostridia bacterium]|nr:DNA primase [Clostridia bacterium]